jgi:TolB protein
MIWRRGMYVGFLVLSYATFVVAQQSSISMEIIKGGGGYLQPLALSKLFGEQSDPGLGQEVRGVLRQDLEVTGLFRVIDYSGQDDTAQDPGAIQYSTWSALGVIGVIAGRLGGATGNSQLGLRLVLHDVTDQRPLSDKEYNGPRGRRREMAHRFSDTIYQELTGIDEGPFDTQVVCVIAGKTASKSKDIVLIDYDGYGVQNLVADGSLNLSPVLSPDGKMLAYTSYRNGTPDIYLRSLTTGREERVTSGPGLALAGSWSPDNRYLALNQTVDGNSDIFVYDTKGKRFSRLTNDSGIDVSPSFSPDGKRLVFNSDRDGSPHLYLVDVQGGAASRLTYEGRYNTAPVWSSRDDMIAYVGRAEDRTLSIFTMHVSGSRRQRLSGGGGHDESPSWSPGGRFVMYTTKLGGSWQRRWVREDGQGDRSLPTTGPSCQSAQWIARMAQ